MQPPSDGDLAADCQDPSDEESEHMQPAARRHNTQVAEEEEEEWTDDEHEGPPPELDSEDEELPGNDEYTYALAGMTL